MPNTQTTLLEGMSAEMKTYYEDTLLDNAEPKLVHDQFADKYAIPKHGGKTIEFRRYAPLAKALVPITEGVTPQGNSNSVSTVTATVAQYGDYVQMSDVLQLTAVDNNLVQTTKLNGAQAGRTLDTVTRDVLCGGTNVMYAPKITDSGNEEVYLRQDLVQECRLTPDLFFKAAAQLSAMNAETINDSFVAIIHPYTAYDLMRSTEWISSHKYAAPENIYNGEIGKIGNVRFIKSSEAKIWKSADLTVNSRTLTVKSIAATIITIKETLSEEEASALSDRLISVGDSTCKILSATAGSAGNATLMTDAPITAGADTKIFPAETGIGGIACFSTIVFGEHAYATTMVEGGGLQHIVKQLGYGDDPLNQRSACGWKAIKVSERLVEEHIIRIESASAYSINAQAN